MEEFLKMMQQLTPMLQKLADIMPDLDDAVTFYKEEKQRRDDVQAGRSDAVKELEKWGAEREAQAARDAAAAAELAKHIAGTYPPQPLT